MSELVDLSYNYRGYDVESVEVITSQASYSASLQLIVNGWTDDTDYSVNGWSVLRPRSGTRIGYDLTSLGVRLNGSAYVERVTLNLRRW